MLESRSQMHGVREIQLDQSWSAVVDLEGRSQRALWLHQLWSAWMARLVLYSLLAPLTELAELAPLGSIQTERC